MATEEYFWCATTASTEALTYIRSSNIPAKLRHGVSFMWEHGYNILFTIIVAICFCLWRQELCDREAFHRISCLSFAYRFLKANPDLV